MPRRLLIGAAVLTALAAGGAAMTPFVARLYAQAQVDGAFARIRQDSTSVVNRGPVTIDVSTWTAFVADVSIVSPSGSTTTIGRLSIEHPKKVDGKLTARKVTIEGMKVVAGEDVTTAPRVEIFNYAGPERGLVSTPGVGREGRSQADIIAQVSFDSAIAPRIEFFSGTTKMRRSALDGSIGRVTNGVAERISLKALTVDAPDPRENASGAQRALSLSANDILVKEIDLPTLWRFYAGDGAGAPDPLVAKLSASNLSMATGLQSGAQVSLSAAAVEGDGFKLRALAFPLADIERAVARQRSGEPPLTPAEIRDQLMMGIDASRAVSFDGIALKGVAGKVVALDGDRTEWTVGALKIGPYADARLDAVGIEALKLTGLDGLQLGLALGEVEAIDASGLLAYLDKVGRDQALMTFRPTAEDVIRVAPRLKRVDLSGLSVVTGSGRLEAQTARADIDAPLDAVPQKAALAVSGFDFAPSAGGWFADTMRTASIDRLRGSAKIDAALDPGLDTLTIDAFDYRLDNLGELKARGGLAKVDPALALATGSAFIDKLSMITLLPFRFRAVDDGAVATILSRAAEKAGVSPEVFREQAAAQAEQQVSRLFGPPAGQSGRALSEFLRDPRSIEVLVNPRSPDSTLVEFLQAWPLGPAGIAQTIDVSILNRR